MKKALEYLKENLYYSGIDGFMDIEHIQTEKLLMIFQKALEIAQQEKAEEIFEELDEDFSCYSKDEKVDMADIIAILGKREAKHCGGDKE